MRIFAFSDLRVQSPQLVSEAIGSERPDIILYGGDDLDRLIFLNEEFLLRITDNYVRIALPSYSVISSTSGLGLSPDAIRVLRIALREEKDYLRWKKLDCIKYLSSIPFYSVRGNDDTHLLEHNGSEYIRIKRCDDLYIDGRTIKVRRGKAVDLDEPSDDGIYTPIHSKYAKYKVGKGVNSFSVFGISCTEGLKSRITNTPDQYADIYLSHVPPKGILDLSVRFGLEHIGSFELRRSILKHRPRFLICGHSHFWGGYATRLGSTIVLNVSSGDERNDVSVANYAIIDTSNWSYKAKSRRDKSKIRVRGFSSLKQRLKKYTLRVRDSSTNTEILKLCEEHGIEHSRYKQRVESLNWKSPKIERPLNLPNFDKCAFLDVETGRAAGDDPGRLWLVGISYREELKQFLWPTQKKRFFQFLRKKKIGNLIHWSPYDRKVLKPILIKAKIQPEFIDACQRTGNCVVWHSYRLGDLCDAILGQETQSEEISGLAAGIYADHLIFERKRCRLCPSKKEIVSKIRSHNRNEILKLVRLCKKLSDKSKPPTKRKPYYQLWPLPSS